MVTSSAVVGLVRDQQIRLTGERHGDGDALGAGRPEKLVRIGIDALLRHRKARTRSSNAIASRRALGCRKTPGACAAAQQPWRPTVCIGLSAVIGS